ncbi:hypothetical protein ACR6C2_07400 [Streptomyces sp. INA 01156]
MCGDGLVELPGTVRARSPEETWQLVAGRLPAFGITRVARLTGLDCIGLPVWTAIRPASRTLSTSQGKGATDLLARLSAVLEAIELWHVEQPLPIVAYGPAEEVAPGCPVAALPLTVPYEERALARVVWEWTSGTGLVSGAKTPARGPGPPAGAAPSGDPCARPVPAWPAATRGARHCCTPCSRSWSGTSSTGTGSPAGSSGR